ncbi:MAG: hypothetical protein AUJ20_12585 [Comamonadaceae bacterium CG1_02_60_18]|nr:MAG: hypothetical protein AUJ20_12585 [Comamonadaceae bacterium CG1_02_60_18]PIQ50718.1 MAG: hypothetical protein COW02_19095 [Comamonadaceae bacterium CG12_big_fil_rev_8_21_14_0_65_59_15]
MHKPLTPRHVWRTAAQSDIATFFRADLITLENHLNACPQIHRHLLTLQGVSVSIHGFVATRLVTTLMVIAGLMGLGYWML